MAKAKKYKVKSKKAQAGTQDEFYVPGNETQYFQTGYDEYGNPIQYNPMDASYEQAAAAEQFSNTARGPQRSGSRTVRKQRRTGVFNENPYVKDFNILATGVTGIANAIGNNRLQNAEQRQIMSSLEPPYWENMEADGLNNIPMYTKYGGGIKQTGGRATRSDSLRVYNGQIAQNKYYANGKFRQALNSLPASLDMMKKTIEKGNTTNHSLITAKQTAKDIIEQPTGLQRKKYLDTYGLKPDQVLKKIGNSIKVYQNQDRNSNQFQYQDLVTPAIDFNAPFSVYDKRISPQGIMMREPIDEGNTPGENVSTFYYDPIKVKPVDLLTDKEYQLRFGKSKPKPAPVQEPVVRRGRSGRQPLLNVEPGSPSGVTRSGVNAPQPGPIEKLPYVVDFFEPGEDGRAMPTQRRFSSKEEADILYGELNKRRTNWTRSSEGNVSQYYEKQAGGSTKGKRMKYSKKQSGGDVDTITGLPDDMSAYANVEAEAGEILQHQNGQMAKVSDSGNSHEEGGEDFAGIERVLEDTSTSRKDKASKALRITPEVAGEILGIEIKRPVSHAKAFEMAAENLEKEEAKYTRARKNSNLTDEITKVQMQTMEINSMFEDQLPTIDGIFDILFDHQEQVKDAVGIQDDGTMKRKYGGKVKAQMGTYSGGRTPDGRTTPEGNPNGFAFPGGLEAYKSQWSPVLNLDQYNTVAAAQAATYDYLVKNQPDVAASVWKNQGLTAKGRQMINPESAVYNKSFADAAIQMFDMKGKLKPDVKLTPEQLSILNPAYSDNMLGIRAITPSQFTTTTGEEYPTTIPPVAGQNPPGPVRTPGVTINPNFPEQPENRFFEPTYWSDIATPMISLADSMTRDPELYNPVEFNQLRLKQLDPTATLNANQADFNAATDQVDVNSGTGAANMANALGQKYRVNNQVLSQYDNQNAQIKNQEIQYNTNVRDRQSVADAKTRGDYYRNVQLGRENQRLQRLQSIEDLARVDQMKRRQNRSGNLVLKLSPAFDQYGEYNGYQYMPYLPPELGYANSTAQPTPSSGPGKVRRTSRTTTTTTFRTADGRVIKKVDSNN